MKKERMEQQGDINYDIEWSTLGEYLAFLENKGVSCNIASFVGATTIRINALGYEDRSPIPEELDHMRMLVREAMEEGAVGISTSLIYAPAFFAGTQELIEFAEKTGIHAEIYHLKAASRDNWHKMDLSIAAHNSILVDGAGQKIRDRSSRGEIIDFRRENGEPGSVDYAAGDATAAYSGRLDKFIRHVYYTRPRDFLIIDELEAPEPVRYDWLLHSLEKMEIDEKNRELTIRKGDAMLVVQFISPENLEFSQTNKFSVEPGLSYPEGFAYPDQWHLTVSTTKKTEAATFIVKMKVRSTGDLF